MNHTELYKVPVLNEIGDEIDDENSEYYEKDVNPEVVDDIIKRYNEQNKEKSNNNFDIISEEDFDEKKKSLSNSQPPSLSTSIDSHDWRHSTVGRLQSSNLSSERFGRLFSTEDKKYQKDKSLQNPILKKIYHKQYEDILKYIYEQLIVMNDVGLRLDKLKVLYRDLAPYITPFIRTSQQRIEEEQRIKKEEEQRRKEESKKERKEERKED